MLKRIYLCSEIEARKMDISIVENGISEAVFFDKSYKEKDVDIEIRVEATGQYIDTYNIKLQCQLLRRTSSRNLLSYFRKRC